MTTVQPSEYRELSDRAHKVGFKLRCAASDAERFVIAMRYDDRTIATFSDLDAVRDWLAD